MNMRKAFALIVSVAALFAVISGVAFAQSTQPSPGQVPTVSNLKPFSPEADFMSLAGYLRYLMHQATGQWVTYAEATRVVRQQGAQ